MSEWRPIAILANVQVNEAIGNDKLAVAGISDARMGDCISTQPELKDFLSRASAFLTESRCFSEL